MLRLTTKDACRLTTYRRGTIVNSNTYPYPIVKPTPTGKTHYLRTASLAKTSIDSATNTLCNVDRQNAPVMNQVGVNATCKRCLKLAELNASRADSESSADWGIPF